MHPKSRALLSKYLLTIASVVFITPLFVSPLVKGRYSGSYSFNAPSLAGHLRACAAPESDLIDDIRMIFRDFGIQG